MLIIVAGSRWAGNAGRAAGWRAGTFGCGDANQAAGEEEEEREARGEGEFMDAKSASERTESGRLPATRDEISEPRGRAGRWRLCSGWQSGGCWAVGAGRPFRW